MRELPVGWLVIKKKKKKKNNPASPAQQAGTPARLRDRRKTDVQFIRGFLPWRNAFPTHQRGLSKSLSSLGNLQYGEINIGSGYDDRKKQMAISTCGKCGRHGFELALFTPIGETRKLTLVQCAACGTAVGALDPATGPQIEAVKNQVAAIDQKLTRIAKRCRRWGNGTAAVLPFHPTSLRGARRTPAFSCSEAKNVGFFASLAKTERERDTSARHHRRRLDLDARGLLHQPDHLYQRHRRVMRAKGLAIDLPSAFRLARYSSMSTTYQVRRTRCSGRAPPASRMALMLSSVWRTCATKPSAKSSSASQPITPPVTMMRPSAATPLA